MKILRSIKRALYFPIAAYFSFWAAVYLRRWKPLIITVTGSSGKTTLLHLFEAQIGTAAVYSHKANSAFGIPFNILGLERKTFTILEWPMFAIRAPFQAYRPVRPEKIYVTEVDAERPGEAPGLAKLLKPDIVVWLSLEEAHGVNYDEMANSQGISDLGAANMSGQDQTNQDQNEDPRDGVKKAMAAEFSSLLRGAKKLAVLNSDNEYITKEAARLTGSDIAQAERVAIVYASEKNIVSFTVGTESIRLEVERVKSENNLQEKSLQTLTVPRLIPASAALSVIAVVNVLKTLNIDVDPDFKNFNLPPGRSSVFKGKKGTTIIDSTYNATFDGMKAMLDLMNRYPAFGSGTAAGEKWLVLGDMIEEGKSEAFEHQELAAMIEAVHPARVVLVGPRLAKYTYPILVKKLGAGKSKGEPKIVSYQMPKQALDYLEAELRGGETILFKGARFLEGVVEHLLADPADISKLCRREAVWAKRRERWGI